MSLVPEFQTTVTRIAAAEGIGLHTGAKVRFSLHPAGADEGIVFVRADLPERPRILAVPEAIDRQALRRRTELRGETGASVAMIEHLLSACLGMGLDNVRVEVEGAELPIFDGSVQPYVELMHQAGLTRLEAPRRFWRLNRPVSLIKETSEIFALPAAQMELAFFAELRHAGIANQSVAIALNPKEFESQLAPARTFCFYGDVELLRAAGLIRGGSLDCAIVLRDGKPMDGDYRLPNELACHKLIDLIGDLAILGRKVGAIITARGTGHALHHEFIDLLRKELSEDV